MTIHEGSRYVDATVVRVKDADGETRPTLYSQIAERAYRTYYRLHVLKAGERYDTIAHNLWGDPELWWMIADLNPEHLYPADTAPGTTIRIPLR